jgi:spore germination protein KB
MLYAFLELETFSCTSELISSAILFFLFSIPILISTSAKIHLEEFLSALGNGIKPVLKAAYPTTINFPFGEMLAFFMYWCHVNSKKIFVKFQLLV